MTTMTFYVKRPGQSEGDRIGDADPWGYPPSIDASLDEWALYLPHQCDAWEIGYGTRGQVLEAAREFRAELDEAIRQLERAESS